MNLEVKCLELSTRKIGKVKINYEVNGYDYPLELSVVDKTPPTIKALEEIRIRAKETIKFSDYITTKDNIDSNLKYEVKGKYNESTPGPYELKIYTKDKSGNETEKNWNMGG